MDIYIKIFQILMMMTGKYLHKDWEAIQPLLNGATRVEIEEHGKTTKYPLYNIIQMVKRL